MRQILLAAVVVVVSQAAFAQKSGPKDQNVRFPFSSVTRCTGETVIVIAEVAELRDGADVVGKASRGDSLPVETRKEDRYQVKWKGKGVWISRADVLPLDRALDHFTEAIRRNPSAVVYRIRAQLRQEYGDLVGALDDCNQAILLDPTQARAYDHRGRVWYEKGERDKAMADFDMAVSLDPKAAHTYSNRGEMRYLNGDSEGAITDFDTAIRLDPKDSAANFNRGRVWESQGDLEKASADYTVAIRLTPHKVGYYLNRGIVSKDQGDLERALTDFDKAIRLDRTVAMSFNNRGLTWELVGDFEKAMVDFDKAIRLDQNCALAFNNRGDAWRAMGDYEKALADFNEAVDANNVDAYIQRAWLRATCPDQRFRDGRKALEDARMANELTSGNRCWSVDAIAAAYAELGDFKKAIGWQKQAVIFARPEDKKQVQHRLELYQAGKPYRDEPVKR